VALRWRKRRGQVAIGVRLGMPASTVHAVLVRCRLSRLSYLDRVTGDVRRHEHDRPGAMLYVDVKKLGNIPDGGVWRFLGQQQGRRHKHRHRPGSDPRSGNAYVHTVIDGQSRIAYAEIHDDETSTTAVAVLRRTVS
jgi:hypothetical protein